MTTTQRRGRQSWPLWLQAFLLAVAIALLGAPEVVSQWGGRGEALAFVSALTVVFLAGCVTVAVGVVVVLFLPRRGLQVLVLGVVGVFGVLGVARLADLARRQAFLAAADRAAPLIDAIETFARQRGGPPRDLEELVPGFLRAIPRTGLPAYPLFTYRLNDARPAPAGVHQPGWQLEVSCHDARGAGRFCYWPDRRYPEQSMTGPVTRVGSWAYFEE